jgi:hypothetical protein
MKRSFSNKEGLLRRGTSKKLLKPDQKEDYMVTLLVADRDPNECIGIKWLIKNYSIGFEQVGTYDA